MSVLNRTSFKNLYGLSGTTFPDNTSGDISESDIRTFGEDLADSFYNKATDTISSNSITDGTVNLKMKVIEIGAWNMDTTAMVQVSHGLADNLTIRDVSVVIIDDSDFLVGPYPKPLNKCNSSGVVNGYWETSSADKIDLYRVAGGEWDSTNYNLTTGPYNRGWVTIWYEE